MKTTLTIISLLLCSTFCHSQDDVYLEKNKKDNAIPKGVTQVFIKNDKTATENYKSVLKFLVNEDYGIAKRDEELGTISTEQISVTKYGLVIKLNILCSDNVIRMSGNFKTGLTMSFGGVTSTDEWDYVRNKGMGGSMIRGAFDKMNEIAIKYGGDISYK